MKLKSGRQVYANRDIFGIDPNGYVTEGFDSSIYWPVYGEPDSDDLTSADMREIADMMIDRWTVLRNSLG